MGGKSIPLLNNRWSRCEAGSSDSNEMYWLVDYNAKRRGFIVAQSANEFEGVVCEQMSNPFSRAGVVERLLLEAEDIDGAIASFMSYCLAKGYDIGGF